MKKIDSIGLRICEYQGKMFERSIEETKCSSAIFIRRFMNSDLAARLDSSTYPYESSSVAEGFFDIDLQYGTSDYGKEKFSHEEMYWIGYLYRYWSYTYEISSRKVYKIVKPGELRKLFFPYHSLDPAQAIERILETKNLPDPTDINYGVQVLRRIREKNQ